MVAPGQLDHAVDEREVELALLGLEQAPIDDGKDGIEVHFDQRGPYPPQVLQAGGSGILQFSREEQERLAVHDQLVVAVPCFCK